MERRLAAEREAAVDAVERVEPEAHVRMPLMVQDAKDARRRMRQTAKDVKGAVVKGEAETTKTVKRCARSFSR